MVSSRDRADSSDTRAVLGQHLYSGITPDKDSNLNKYLILPTFSCWIAGKECTSKVR